VAVGCVGAAAGCLDGCWQGCTFFLDAKTYRQLTTEASVQSGLLGRVQRLSVAFERPTPEPGQTVVGLLIAAVTGPRTASSGECVLTALRAAPQVRSFGETTYGFTTGNVPFALPYGYALGITVSELADAKGQRVMGKISPP
jgi:C-terminal processing protease CtpA/Prc